jgi:hypothetical protein
MIEHLSDPQAILLTVLAIVAAWAALTSWVLGRSQVRVCRFCERIDLTRESTPEWAEPTACADCARLKAALLSRREFRYRLPHNGGDLWP